MSQSTSRDLRAHVTRRAESVAAPQATSHLIRGVQAFTALTSLGAAACLATSLHYDRWHFALAAATLAMLAAMGGGVICMHCVLADRQEFYRRGQLDGWMKGWRGQEPDVDDPLFR